MKEYKTKKIKLPMIDLTADLNVRDMESNYAFGENGNAEDNKLMTSIINARGFVQAPALEEVATEDGNTSYRILQGNRRIRALAYMAEHNEDVFKEIFGAGFLCNVYKDLTDEERETIICDHSTVKRLTDFERLKTVARFNGFGWATKQIANTLGLPVPQVRNYLRVWQLQDADSDAIQTTAHLKQLEIAKKSEIKVPWQALSACANILAQAETKAKDTPDDMIDLEVIKVNLDSPYKGMVASEILADLRKPEESLKKVPTRAEIKVKAEGLPKTSEFRKALEWVLGE